jgi:hypothetical protein
MNERLIEKKLMEEKLIEERLIDKRAIDELWRIPVRKPGSLIHWADTL